VFEGRHPTDEERRGTVEALGGFGGEGGKAKACEREGVRATGA